MHRILQVTFGIVLVLLLIVPTTVVATAVSPSPVPVVAASEIAWQPCATDPLPTRECAELAVPLDYDEPDGSSITLAVAQVPATDQANRIGSLFLNPGGPGGSGVMALPVQYAALPKALQERFDIVGFDPRGVGESAPVRCFDSIAEQIAFLYLGDMPQVPVGPEEEVAWERAAGELAQRCDERNAETLAHLSTANVARDMDRLRQAVGDEMLNYLGTSYGTYLGATYANLFPDRIRAMVLDGVVNPPSYTSFDHGDGDIVGPDTTSFLRILSNQGAADALQEFFDQCAAAGPDRCAYAAASSAETREKFDALMDRLRAEPMVVQGLAGTLTVTYSLVDVTVWVALYAAPTWSGLAQGLQALEEGDTAGFLVATKTLGGPPPTAYVNVLEGQFANNCLDTDNPDDPALYPEMARRAEERTPHFGTLYTYQAMPCAFWPAEDADRYMGPWDANTSATILLISRVYDPATPHSSAVAAAETLANARLLTIDGWGHGFFVAGRSTCADDYMAAYLIDLELPPVDTVCPEDVAPFSEPAQDDTGAAPPAATPGPLTAPSSLPASALPVVAQTATPAAASSVPASGDFSGLVDIGDGRKMYLECRGTESPTVILVDGYRGRGDSWSTDFLQPDAGRMMVRPGVAAFTRVCSYDRPGTVLDENTFSRSAPVPQPQTAADAVADLHALLEAAGVPGPYVLVGHSYGGLVVRLYASTYPDEVAGLLLVDALPAVEKWLTSEQWAAYQQLLNQRPGVIADYHDLETIDVDTSAAQMREAAAVTPLRSLPLVVLTRVRPFDLPPDLPPGFSADALERAWAAGQAELVALVPGTHHVIATESGHGIQADQPELVITAIQQVVDAVRDPSTWAMDQATLAP